MMGSTSSDKASQQTKAKWLCLNCGLEFQGAKTKPECPECFNKCDFLLVRLNKDGLPAVHDAMGDENEVKALELTMPATLDDLEYNDELKELVRKRVLLRAERKKLEEEAEMLRTRKELERLRKGEESEDFNGFNGGFSAAANPAAPLLITALAPTKEEREALLKELSENKELALSLGLMLNAPRYSMPFFPFLGGGKEQTSLSELADALKKLADIVNERNNNDGIREELRELRETLLEVAKRDPVDDIKKLLDLQRTLREELGEDKGRKEEIELLAKAVKEVGENTNKAIASLKATLARMEQERREGSSYERELERLRNQMKNAKEFVDALSDLTRTFSLSSGDSDDYYKRKEFEHKLRLEELEKEKELEEERRRRERDKVLVRLLDVLHKRRKGGEEEDEENEERGKEGEEEEGERGLKLEIDELWKEEEGAEKEEEAGEKKEEEEKVKEEEESKEEEKKAEVS